MSAKGNEEFVDYYELLGVEATAEAGQIKTSYFKLAKDHHPDAGGSTEHMQLLNTAYLTLRDDTKRAAYNKLYNLHYGGLSEDLDLKDEYEVPTSDEDIDNADYFVDQIYAEFYGKDEPDKPKGGKFKGMFRK